MAKPKLLATWLTRKKSKVCYGSNQIRSARSWKGLRRRRAFPSHTSQLLAAGEDLTMTWQKAFLLVGPTQGVWRLRISFCMLQAVHTTSSKPRKRESFLWSVGLSSTRREKWRGYRIAFRFVGKMRELALKRLFIPLGEPLLPAWRLKVLTGLRWQSFWLFWTRKIGEMDI